MAIQGTATGTSVLASFFSPRDSCLATISAKEIQVHLKESSMPTTLSSAKKETHKFPPPFRTPSPPVICVQSLSLDNSGGADSFSSRRGQWDYSRL